MLRPRCWCVCGHTGGYTPRLGVCRARMSARVVCSQFLVSTGLLRCSRQCWSRRHAAHRSMHKVWGHEHRSTACVPQLVAARTYQRGRCCVQELCRILCDGTGMSSGRGWSGQYSFTSALAFRAVCGLMCRRARRQYSGVEVQCRKASHCSRGLSALGQKGVLCCAVCCCCKMWFVVCVSLYSHHGAASSVRVHFGASHVMRTGVGSICCYVLRTTSKLVMAQYTWCNVRNQCDWRCSTLD